MPGASIITDQTPGAGIGTTGVARKDLWRTKSILFACSIAGNTSWLWELLDKPPGSASTFATPTTSSSTMTPDTQGTYRVRLTVNGGGVGNVQTLVYRVRYDSSGVLEGSGWALPAYREVASEANYGGNTRGWAADLEEIFATLRVVAPSFKRIATVVLPADSPYSIPTDKDVIPCNSSAGMIILELPAAPSIGEQKDICDVGNSPVQLLIDGNGHTIDGAASMSMAVAYANMTLLYISAAVGWKVM